MTSLYIEFSIYLRCLAYLLVKRYNHRNLIILVLIILLLIIIQLRNGYIDQTVKHILLFVSLIFAAKISTILIHCSSKPQKSYIFLKKFLYAIQIESIVSIITAICLAHSKIFYGV